MISQAIAKLVERNSLSQEATEECLQEVVDGKASAAQAAAFLTALRLKGESDAELFAIVSYLRENCVRVNAPDAIDVCGTGGDGSNSFNVSTAAAFVVAACGVKVAKHGNKSVSSKCGSADVLEALGANILLGPRQAESVLKQTAVTFLYAPLYHPAMKAFAQVRRELGFRTVFNFVGPLVNPAFVKRQLVGVCDAGSSEQIGRVLLKLGLQKALVVNCGGMDELSLHAPCKITDASGNGIETYEVSCEQYGLSKAKASDLLGGDAAENARLINEIFEGREGPRRDTVAFNAGAALYVAGKTASIASGVGAAEKAIDSGKAAERLEKFIEAGKQHAASKN